MISISQWAGLATNASPYSIPPGASVEQRNLQAITPGRLTCRDGLTPITPSSDEGIVRLYLYRTGLESKLLYQDSLGRIYTE